MNCGSSKRNQTFPKRKLLCNDLSVDAFFALIKPGLHLALDNVEQFTKVIGDLRIEFNRLPICDPS